MTINAGYVVDGDWLNPVTSLRLAITNQTLTLLTTLPSLKEYQGKWIGAITLLHG